MVAEFYPGWLDHWNEPFVRVSAESIAERTKAYLEGGVNFNFYMVHGGTNFAFWSGANYNNDTNIQPDLTSYDYDAPISEAGWATDKYMKVRDVMKQHVAYELPDVPERIPVIQTPEVFFDKSVDVISVLEQQKPVSAEEPMTFEDLGQGYGYVLYRRHFNQPISGMMRVPGIADFATVYVNGKKVGELNRVIDKDSLLVVYLSTARLIFWSKTSAVSTMVHASLIITRVLPVPSPSVTARFPVRGTCMACPCRKCRRGFHA